MSDVSSSIDRQAAIDKNSHVDSRLYNRSVMLEIVDRQKPGMPIAAYTITVPPESIEVEEPQRLNMTKTFGGLFIDDYGPDVLKITISGTTGGSDLRRTWTAMGDPTPRNGKASFFHLRDDLMRYKNSYTEYAKYDIYYYDLSSIDDNDDLNRDMSGLAGASIVSPRLKAVTATADGYVCALQSFRMSRSKDRPLWYSYRIELIGLRPMGKVTSGAKPGINCQNPLTTIDNMVKLWNGINSAYSKVKGVRDKIDNVFNIVSRAKDEMTAFFRKTNELAVYPIKTLKRAMGAVKEAADFITAFTVGELGAVGMAESLVTETRDLILSAQIMCADMVAFGKTPKAAGQSGGDVAAGGGVTERKNVAMAGVSESESQTASIVLNAITGETIPVTVYGHVIEKITDSTTLDGLAMTHYGDPSLNELLALYNGIETTDDLVIGDTIKIPVLVQSSALNNYVYEETLTDVYGRDIRLDSSGNIMLSYGNDFATIEGPDNVVQAVNLRLSEPLGARLRLALYGIRAAIGSPFNSRSPFAYLTANIKDTLTQDPRVREVRDIILRADGDTLRLGCNVELVRYGDVVPYTAGVT